MAAQAFQQSSSAAVFNTTNANDNNEQDARKWVAAGSSGIFMVGVLTLDVQGVDYKFRRNFQFDCNGMSWLHQDQFRHSFFAYNTARMLDRVFTWGGIAEQQAAW